MLKSAWFVWFVSSSFFLEWIKVLSSHPLLCLFHHIFILISICKVDLNWDRHPCQSGQTFIIITLKKVHSFIIITPKKVLVPWNLRWIVRFNINEEWSYKGSLIDISLLIFFSFQKLNLRTETKFEKQ